MTPGDDGGTSGIVTIDRRGRVTARDGATTPAVVGDVLGGEAVAHRARADRRGAISGNSKMISSEQMPKRRPSLRICET